MSLTERIGCKTGGVSFSPFTSSVKGSSDPLAFLMVRGKVMGDKSGDMLDIMRDVLLTARLDDKERFKQVRLKHAHRHMHRHMHRQEAPSYIFTCAVMTFDAMTFDAICDIAVSKCHFS